VKISPKKEKKAGVEDKMGDRYHLPFLSQINDNLSNAQ
jgi:hypothetical protein